jgi:Tol biopolymer transport system component
VDKPERAAGGYAEHQGKECVETWKAIADYLGRTIRTAQRWEHEEGLPVHRHKHADRDSVYAFKDELDAWLTGRNPPANGSLIPLRVEGSNGSPNSLASPPHGVMQRAKKPSLWLWAAVAALTALAIASVLIFSTHSAASVRLLAYPQLTYDGHQKDGLATDGVWAYFFESGDAGGNLCRVPVSGGEVTCAAVNNLPSARVMAVSPDGAKVLLREEPGFGQEGALWVASASGGQAGRLGNVISLGAAWAPAKRILYAHESGIWTINEDGTHPVQILKTSEVAHCLGWSPDGGRLWYVILKPANPPPAVWVVNSDGTDPHRFSEDDRGSAELCCGFWFSNQKSFGFLSSPLYLPTLLVRGENAWNPLLRSPAISRAAFGLPQIRGFAADAARNRILVLSAGPWHGGVFRLDSRKSGFQSYLDGIPANDVDFSPDGHYLVYVDTYDHSLWRYDQEKRNKTQLIPPPFHSMLPRWSPDGQWIALAGQGLDMRWRIYRIPRQGGTPEQVIANDPTNEGAPTWSPDSHSLVFGKAECAQSGDCGIYQYNLLSRSLSMLLGSEGFRTARWSPDGQHIAALRPSDGGLILFDFVTRRWRKIYGPVTRDCLAWSHNSMYLYIQTMTGQDHIITRVNIRTGASEQVANLKDLRISGMEEGLWFGLTPDDSLLVSLGSGVDEVFSVTFQMP